MLKKTKKKFKKIAKEFGVKEKVLNFTSNNYHLTRPKKVGEVMAMIRECQPKSFDEWKKYYFEKAYTKTKISIKVTKEILDELGQRLYEKITEVVIPEWTAAFKEITLQDCIEYIYEVTLCRTYDGFISEKSIVNDDLVKRFPEVKFVESDADLDHAGDIDYIGYVNDKAFGIQIKPVTIKSNVTKPISERMRANFDEFEEKYGGKVFTIISATINDKKEIVNKEILEEIRKEIDRLKKL